MLRLNNQAWILFLSLLIPTLVSYLSGCWIRYAWFYRNFRQSNLPRQVCRSSEQTIDKLGYSFVWSTDVKQKICSGCSPKSNIFNKCKGKEMLHIFMDIENTKYRVLNSKSLVHASIEPFANEVGLTVLSHICHDSSPTSISCTSLFPHGRLSIYTWPKYSVASIDLLIDGAFLDAPLIASLEKHFSIVRKHLNTQKNSIKWKVVERTFSKNESSCTDQLKYPDTDFLHFLKYHYQMNSQKPLYMYGNEKSFSSNEIYYEALVHPAMLMTNTIPKNIAIIGGNKNFIIKEILKHDIDTIEVIDNETGVIMQEASTFRSGQEINLNSVDDNRVNFTFTSLDKWLANCGTIDENLHDVIIIDSFEFMYSILLNKEISQLLFDSLSKNGVIVMNFGFVPVRKQSRVLSSLDLKRKEIVAQMENDGFKNIHIYDEMHCNNISCSFLLACKTDECGNVFFMNSAEIELLLTHRFQTISKNYPLVYVDAPILENYKVPSKIWQLGYIESSKLSCNDVYDGFQKFKIHFNSSNFEVKMSSKGSQVGRGVFALVDIPKGSLIMQEYAGRDIFLSTGSDKIMQRLIKTSPATTSLNAILNYVDGYGFDTDDGFIVEASILSFVNHGCDGSYNIGESLCENENDSYNSYMSVLTKNEEYEYKELRSKVYNPIEKRHFHQLSQNTMVTRRNVTAGEELFGNYLVYTKYYDEVEWRELVKDLEQQCNGGTGLVVNIEHTSS